MLRGWANADELYYCVVQPHDRLQPRGHSKAPVGGGSQYVEVVCFLTQAMLFAFEHCLLLEPLGTQSCHG